MAPLESILFWIGLALYSTGWLALLLGLVFTKPRVSGVATWILASGLLAHSGSILARWIATGHGPVMRDFENATAGGWTLMMLTLLLAWRRPQFRSLAAATSPVVIVLMGYGLTQAPELESLTPPYKTIWLYVHVVFAWISFAAFTLASGAAGVFLLKNAGENQRVRG
ncbi:MAG: cytochrome c biogenesis protein CcsA, partial [Planctomycetota bacterium]